jgi:hypothetical protein
MRFFATVARTKAQMNRALYFICGVLAAAAAFGLGIALREDQPGPVVTRYGETRDPGTGWRVSVDADSGRHSVAHVGFSLTPAWAMKPGWFVLIENDQRAWSYNGEDQLIVFVASDGKGRPAGAFSPDNIPFPVPDAVVRRIGEQRVRAIAIAAREARERLGLAPAR